ncbi:hypothetical protein WICPIJ_003976 [Wickerhamomyces pijperi]|uniref:F-box domain-containing protein n=1 Tax=Wickerhamomyces pijperi TaxID=599730 RepID=A0A9P8TNC5_WICPI|nr:hypothetical protein WICPIJ_003976 [Wickerhamomyces pijperi]
MFNQLPIELLAEILGYLILLDPHDTYTIAKELCQISGFKEAICLKLKVLTLAIVVESSKQTYETYFLPKIAPKFRFLDREHTKLETIYIPDSDATRVNNDLRTMKESPSCSLQTNNLKPPILAAIHKLFTDNQGEPYIKPERHDFLLLLELHDYETDYKDSVILSRLPQFVLRRSCMRDVDPWVG